MLAPCARILAGRDVIVSTFSAVTEGAADLPPAVPEIAPADAAQVAADKTVMKLFHVFPVLSGG